MNPNHPRETEWGIRWKELQESRRKPDDASYWDRRAERFHAQAGHSAYVSKFLEYARILPEENILDMGCGAGTLAIPLAEAGHTVTAADFSEGMLGYLADDRHSRGLDDRITIVRTSWEDDWDAAGIVPCDIAIASRSIATSDMETALLKLSAHARRRVCITLSAGVSPRCDSVLYEALGRDVRTVEDAFFAEKILSAHGIDPEVSLIESPKLDVYGSLEEARHDLLEPLGTLTDDELDAFDRYFAEHLVEETSPDGTTRWVKDYHPVTRWTFMAWDIA